MKRYLLILLTTITLVSCSPDDYDSNFYFEWIPVTAADVPDEFVYGQTYELTVHYELPNDCTIYYDYDYIYRGDSRIIATIGMVDSEAICADVTSEGEYTITVEARQNATYIFKFWQGIDDDGDNIYLIIEVPVIV